MDEYAQEHSRLLEEIELVREQVQTVSKRLMKRLFWSSVSVSELIQIQTLADMNECKFLIEEGQLILSGEGETTNILFT